MDFSKINELKPYDLNCNIFDVYSYNGLSMQELLCQFFTKINDCIKTSNETIDLAEWLVNEGLKQETALKLTTWLNDGTLENLINVTLFENLNNKIDNTKLELVDLIKVTENSLLNEINNSNSYNGKVNKTLIKLTNKEPVKIACYGDSITTGSKANSSGEVETLNTYPNVLEETLKIIYQYNEIEVINKGVPGETSLQIKNRFINDNINEYDLILFLIGTNDLLQDKDLQELENNIKVIVNKLEKENKECIFLTLSPIFNPTFSSKIDKANKIIKNLENKITIVDLYSDIMSYIENINISPTDLLPDFVHFNDDCYKLISDSIINTVFYSNMIQSNTISPAYNTSIQTNGVIEQGRSDNIFGGTLSINNHSSQYFRAFIYNTKNKYITLYYPKGDGGGLSNIKLNGRSVLILNQYSQTTTWDNKVTIECDLGLNIIEVLGSDISISTGSTGTRNCFFISSIEVSNNLHKKYVSFENGFTGSNNSLWESVYISCVDDVYYMGGMCQYGSRAEGVTICDLGIKLKEYQCIVIGGEHGNATVYFDNEGDTTKIKLFKLGTSQNGWLTFNNIVINNK